MIDRDLFADCWRVSLPRMRNDADGLIDPTRVRCVLLDLAAHHNQFRQLSNIADALGIATGTVSHCIRGLVEAGLVIDHGARGCRDAGYSGRVKRYAISRGELSRRISGRVTASRKVVAV